MKTKNEIEVENQGDVAARLAQLQKEAAELEKQLARGTGDITKHARAAKHRVGGLESLPLIERIEIALRVKPHSIEELSRELKEPAGKISAAMKPLRGRLFNAGTELAPAWFVVVGDKAEAADINSAVEALVSYREFTFPELVAATGARQGRVSGAIVKLQRDPKSRIVNLGSDAKAKWRILPEGIQLSKLKPR